MSTTDSSARARGNVRRGKAAEQALARYLRPWFSNAVRAVRTGSSAAADPGDIEGVPGLIASVKDCAVENWPTWWAELDAMLAADPVALGVVIVKRRGRADPGAWWCHLRVNDLIGLVEGDRQVASTVTARVTVDTFVALLVMRGYATNSAGDPTADLARRLDADGGVCS